MKKIALLLCFSACLLASFAQIKDPIIMSIGGQDVSKSEFEYIWNKNNTNNTTDKKSLDEYVDLFINFKLKVAEAKAQGIDTTKSFVNELNGYRRQLTAPYLVDKTQQDAMFKQAYDRGKEYIEASHILLMVKADVAPDDTLKVYQNAMKLYNRLLKGEDFAKLAKENSEDGSKMEGGYLGFATGLRYVYPFENVLFDTPIGKFSKPFRSQYGYHIVKVHSRRPALGQYRSAHIMKLIKPDATPEVKQATKDSIFKIYNAIKNGGDFQLYATKHSDDQTAAARNGEYGMMLCGSLPIEYEDAVFKTKVGDFSEPFQSKYGWHIVKALEFKPYPALEDKESQDFISKAIKRSDRAQVLNEMLVDKLKKEYNYSFDANALEQFNKAFNAIKNAQDSTLLKTLSASDATLFTLSGITYTQKQFAKSLNNKDIKTISLKSSFDGFVQQVVMNFEDRNLENKYPEFGHLMQEYKDGILLFEVSNREVWEKASLDTVGLQTYFEANKSKYAWEKPHYKGFIIQCANAEVAKKAEKMIKKMPLDSIAVTLKRTFNTDSTTLIKTERGLYAQGDNANVDFLAYKIGKLATKAELPVSFLKGYSLKKGPESYLDVRGLVISDYQNYLEERWIASLKAKFKVIVYKDVVNTVNKN